MDGHRGPYLRHPPGLYPCRRPPRTARCLRDYHYRACPVGTSHHCESDCQNSKGNFWEFAQINAEKAFPAHLIRSNISPFKFSHQGAMMIINRKILFLVAVVTATTLSVPLSNASTFAKATVTAADTAALSACASINTANSFAHAFEALPQATRVARRATSLATLHGYVVSAQTALTTAIRANPSYRTWQPKLTLMMSFATTGNGTPAIENAVSALLTNCTALHRSTGR